MLFETLEHGSVAEYVMKQAKREKPEPPTPSRFAKRVFTTSVPTNRASCSFALTPSSSESLERQQKYCVQSRYYHKTGLLSCSEHYHPFDFFSRSFFPRAQRAVPCSKISFLPQTCHVKDASQQASIVVQPKRHTQERRLDVQLFLCFSSSLFHLSCTKGHLFGFFVTL